MNRTSEEGALEVGDLTVDLGRRRVARGEEPLRLTRRTFDLLVALATHAPNLVPHQVLIDEVWGADQVVSAENLAQHVALLRKALGDEASSPRYIEVRRGEGYRLIPAVRREPATEQRDAGRFRRLAIGSALVAVAGLGGFLTASFVADRQTAPRETTDGDSAPLGTDASPDRYAASDPSSLIVLPFTSESPDPEQEYFADGLTAELINVLPQVEGLTVFGSTSSFALRGDPADPTEIGRRLDVAYVLEGTVRSHEDRLRVSAQLVDTATGHQLWSESYESRLEDPVSIQVEVGRAVARALNAELGSVVLDEEGLLGLTTEDFRAFDAYVRAWGLLEAGGRENTLRAEELFRQAIAYDPTFDMARTRLLQTLDRFPSTVPERVEDVRGERDALARALAEEIDAPWLAEGIRSTLFWREREWAAAERSLARTRELAPRAAHREIDRSRALILRRVGRISETLDHSREAVRTDPLSLDASAILQYVLHSVGDLAEAEAEYERSRDLLGERSAIEQQAFFRALVEGYERAEVEERRARVEEVGAWSPLEAEIWDTLDDRAEALSLLEATLERAPGSGGPNWLLTAWWADFLGDTDLALRALRRWIEFSGGIFQGPFTPTLKNTRSAPGFEQLVRDYGYLDYWRETGEWGDFCRPVGGDDFECGKPLRSPVPRAP